MVFAFGPVDGVVPGVGRGAEAKEFHGFRRHAAFGEIIAGSLAGGFIKQAILPALGDLLVNLEQLVFEMARLLFAGGLIEFEGNFGAFSQPADGVHEADVFVFLDEGEHVAALVAAEAVKNLFMRIDVEAGGLFLVKGAEGGEVGAGAFQRQIGPDDVHNVAGGANAFAGCGGKRASHACSASRRGDAAVIFSYEKSPFFFAVG